MNRICGALLAVVLVVPTGVVAQQREQNQERARGAYKPDNTGTTLRDRAAPSKTTADETGNRKENVEKLAKIRRSIVQDDALSVAAHNVKIIDQNGKVVLRGPVNSQDEKVAVERKATEVVGAGNVRSELEVADMSSRTASRDRPRGEQGGEEGRARMR